MSHASSHQDRTFRADFEAGRVAPAEFDHRAHVRLAYVYLTESDVGGATKMMREALLAFLQDHAHALLGIDPVLTGSPGAVRGARPAGDPAP